MVKARVRRKTTQAAALSDSHLEELRKSGITKELAEEAGLFTESKSRLVAVMLGRATARKWMGPALCFPYFDLDGKPETFKPENGGPLRDYVRLKPGVPQGEKKYLGPLKADQRIYLPPGVRRKEAENVELELWLTEGEKKAIAGDLAGEKAGFCCVGLPGVWGWKKAKKDSIKDELGASLAGFAFKGRNVVICFDSDARTNPQVTDAAERLADVLYEKGAAEVAFAVPPDGKGGKKQGLDDYLVAGGKVEELGKTAEVMDPDRILELVSATDLKAKTTSWLWDKWIPLGELSVFDGAPGCAKTQVMMELVSRISHGSAMPPVELSNGQAARHSVIMPGEDDVDKTLLPRLEAAGADMRFVTFAREREGKTLQLPRHIHLLERAIVRTKAVLLVIDPLMAYVETGKIDTHNDASSRALLRPLQAVAQRTGAAIVVIRHHNKKSGESAMNRGGGSIAFAATARSVFMAGEEPESEDGTKVFASVKSNLGPPPTSISYRVEGFDNDYGGTSRVVWGEEVDYRADDVVAHKRVTTSAPKSAEVKREAETLLLDGPMESVKFERTISKKTGASEKTIKNVTAGFCERQKYKQKWWIRLESDRFEWEDPKPKRRGRTTSGKK